MNIESSVKKVIKKSNLSLSVALSIAIHLMMVGGFVYAAMHTEPPTRLDDGEGMSVMMLDLSAPVQEQIAEPAVEQNVSPLIEEQLEVKPEETKIEAEIKPEDVQPDPLPEIAQEAKIIIEEPKKTPPAKPKKTPSPQAKKEPVKPATKPINTTSNQISGNTVTNIVPSKTGTGSESSNKPLNRARPGYPNRARMMGIEGKVIVQFDVDPAGKVANIRIVSETPQNMFAREVRRAMARWRYEVNKPAKNLSTTFIFNLTGNVEMK